MSSQSRLPIHEVFHPRNGSRNTNRAIVSILGFNSSWRTVRPRLHVLADTLQSDVIGIVRRGTDTTRPDPQLRRRLSSLDSFLTRCHEDSEWLDKKLFRYPKRLFEGSSAGAVMALGMVAARPGMATHLLIREGFNQRAKPQQPEAVYKGALRVVRQQLPDVPYIDRYKPAHWQPTGIPEIPDSRPPAQKVRAAARLAVAGSIEMWHWGENTCSGIPQQLARKVAASQPSVAVNSIEYEHGIGGDPVRSWMFAQELEALRGDHGAPLQAVVLPNFRHSHLLDPALQSQDIEHTFALR